MITRLTELNSADQSKVLTLIAQATDFDGIPPVTEHVLLHLRHGGDKADNHLLAHQGDELAGYAHLDLTDEVEGPSAEIVVSPTHRGRGFGTELVGELKRIAGTRLRLWSHGDLPGAKNIALKSGFLKARTVIQMRRSLVDPITERAGDFQTREFQLGSDDAAWISANNRAFAGHPEQSNWNARDFEIRSRESWFDEKGFLLIEEAGEIAGFCWTKIHGGHTHRHGIDEPEHDHDPIGEIYIMGVDPKFQGRGIGRAVTIAGLKYLRNQGIFSAMLYVDADNTSAINLYESLGFKEWGRDVLYRCNLNQ